MASKPLDTLALLEVLFILVVLDVLVWLSTSTVTETLGGSVIVSDWWFDNIAPAAATPDVGSLLLLMLFEKRWVYSERETFFEIFNVY